MHHKCTMHQKFFDLKTFILWHDQFGHPRSIMIRQITKNSHGHPVKESKNSFTKWLSMQFLFLGKIYYKIIFFKLRGWACNIFTKKFKKIFLGKFILHVDHLVISWFWLMHPIDCHKFTFFLLEMSHLLDIFLKLLD